MSAENVAVVRDLYDGFAAGNVGAVLGAMSADIVWNEAENFPYADGNPYVGPQAIAEGVFARCIGEWDGFTVNVEEILDAGDTVVALGRYAGLCKGSGKVLDAQFSHVWRVADGKVTRFQQYTDTLQATERMSA
ncbi:MAG TPA: nuclear transport factor 2 family protein [Allosphingosinicella sp.]